ncbi:MAG TPA: hypothetical protein DCP71_08345, partial [Verrucomicrobiales bacterium]|nr:hypothetical protein [Verrucomicrobiales bacterium]
MRILLPKRTFGYAALPIVTGLALMLTFSLTMLFKKTLMNRDQASKTQLRMDYHQREEALLRALVAVFPNRAIECMKANLAEGDRHDWNAIFSEAITLSSASNRLSPEMLQAQGLQHFGR